MASKYSHSAVYRLAGLGGIRIALTGSASTGKTTQAAEFMQSGFVGVPEYASILIQQAKTVAKIARLKLPKGPGEKVDDQLRDLFAKLHVYHPFVDNPAFQVALTEGCLEQERPHVERRKGLVCFDRTHLDVPPYCRAFGLPLPPQFGAISPPPAERFDLCFLLEPIGAIVDNGVRIEMSDALKDLAIKVGPGLHDEYRDNGVEVIRVPAMPRKSAKRSVAARQAFMWKHITKFAERKLATMGITV
jgi:predicted ATPase